MKHRTRTETGHDEAVDLRVLLERLAQELTRMAASAKQVQEALSFEQSTVPLSSQSVRDIQSLDAITQKLEDLACLNVAASQAIPSAILLPKTAVFSGLRLHELVGVLDPGIRPLEQLTDRDGVEWL